MFVSLLVFLFSFFAERTAVAEHAVSTCVYFRKFYANAEFLLYFAGLHRHNMNIH